MLPILVIAIGDYSVLKILMNENCKF